jgi:hypothetical protein
MLGVLIALVAAALSFFKTRTALQLENLALRHQLGVLRLSDLRAPSEDHPGYYDYDFLTDDLFLFYRSSIS